MINNIYMESEEGKVVNLNFHLTCLLNNIVTQTIFGKVLSIWTQSMLVWRSVRRYGAEGVLTAMDLSTKSHAWMRM